MPPSQIRVESAADKSQIRELHRLAFGGEAEGRLVDALREGGYTRLSLVAEAAGEIVGHLLFSRLPIRTPAGTVEALALAPVAVRPDYQRQGIGSRLIREGLRRCREQGHRIVVVLGHPEYYPRFGFSARLAEPLRCAYSGPALMALELEPGTLAGIAGELEYPPPFRDV
ncbi:MAG: GNAT family N-acetyltransferase [Armatimonadota bacterium]